MIAEFSVSPAVPGGRVSEYVARCLRIVEDSGLPYQFHAMGTVLEGDFDAVMDVIARCHKAVAADCERVSTLIKIDDRKGATGEIERKVRSVEAKIGRALRTEPAGSRTTPAR